MSARAWLAVAVLTPLAAASISVGGPIRLPLNLGPGDAQFITGFRPEYEIDQGVATHWTTYHGSIQLPLQVQGPTRLSFRFARILPQTAVVDVLLDDRKVEHFECRGGVWQEHSIDLGWLPTTAGRIGIEVDSHDRQDLGLKLDWVRLEVEERGRAELTGSARWRPALTVGLSALILIGLGWRSWRALAWLAPAVLAMTIGLRLDPWFSYRLLAGIPECLAAAAAGIGILRLGRSRAGTWLTGAGRLAATIALHAFLLRAAALNHPDFYYPDLQLHAHLVGVLHDAGLDFLRSPSSYLWGEPGTLSSGDRGPSGLWIKQVGGRLYAMPYSLAFHAPFALLAIDEARLIPWLKIAGAALSTVPIFALAALAQRLGASSLGVALLLLLPTYMSRLSLGMLPALFGSAADMGWVVWWARRPPGEIRFRTVLTGALLTAACQLAYVSGCLHTALMVGLLCVVALLEPNPDRYRRALAVIGIGALGTALSVGLYYRHFLGSLAALGTGTAIAGAPEVLRSWPGAVLARLVSVFGWAFPVAAAGGLFLLLRRTAGRWVLCAWTASGVLLVLGRAGLSPLRYAHEELWLAPLIALAAGHFVRDLWRRGGYYRVPAVALLAWLVADGARLQWQALAAQLGNAL